MDGFGFDLLRLLIVMALVALCAGCSVSLADTSPDVVNYCPVSVSSEHENEAVDVSNRSTTHRYDPESDCVHRLPEA